MPYVLCIFKSGKGKIYVLSVMYVVIDTFV